MDDRQVTSVSVNASGYVSRLWNDDGEWSSQSAEEVILELELGERAYYVRWPEGPAQIIDGTDAGGRFVTCYRSGLAGNALLSLPRHESVVEADLAAEDQLA